MYIEAAKDFYCSARNTAHARRAGRVPNSVLGQNVSQETLNAGYLEREVVCLRFQLLAPWLRRALYEMNTYAIVKEPAEHSGGKLAGIRVQYTSYWASNIIHARYDWAPAVSCSCQGAPGAFKVER